MEWRDEREQAARDAAVMRRHGLDVRERLRDAMARGDRIWLQSAATRCTGEVIEVDDDLVSLRTAGSRIDVRIDAVPQLSFGLVEMAAGAGRTPPLRSGGFRGRLLAAEDSGAQYVVQVRDAGALEGRVLVGRDHVDVVSSDGTTTTVTVAMISSVTRSAPR